MRTLRSTVAATAALFAVLAVSPASAATQALGTLPIGTTLFNSLTVTGAFTDDYTFTIAQTSVFSTTTVTNSAAVLNPWTTEILNSVPSVVASTSSILVGGTTESLQNIVLAAGSYTLRILATVNPNPGGTTSYNGNITISNVPLPGALPMFATGLGGLALLMRRRKKATKA